MGKAARGRVCRAQNRCGADGRNMPISPSLAVARLIQVFKNYPDIQAVYLFGSQAQGRARADSDIDLAIVPRSAALRKHKLDILTDLVEVGFERVDLVFLDGRDVVLGHQAVRLNQVIYSTPDFDSGSYFSLVIRQYLDFLPYLKVQREAMKRRMLHAER